MNRARRRAPEIAAAYDLIPPRIAERLHPDFFVGADPVFAGLHTFTDASCGRSYRDTAHVAYAHHQDVRPRSERMTTVVIPQAVSPTTVVHELGHVLHEQLDWGPWPEPVNWYAATNQLEAFAEAFTCWLCPDEYWNVQDYLARDHATLALFEQLAA